MSDKFKNSKFCQKLKNMQVSRIVYVAIICVILAVTLVVAITVAANRARRNGGNEEVTSAKEQESVTTSTGNNDQKTPGGKNNNEESTSGDSKQTSTGIPKLTLPANGIVSKRHDATLQVFSTTMNDYRVHIGVDIITSESAPVYAAAEGKVAQIWEDPLMGYCVALGHDGECFTIYKNLAKDLADGIEVGAKVGAGQLIGAVGDSAMVESAEEPHLHFEMTVAGLAVDPLEYFDDNAIASLSSDTGFEDVTGGNGGNGGNQGTK